MNLLILFKIKIILKNVWSFKKAFQMKLKRKIELKEQSNNFLKIESVLLLKD